MFSTGQVEGSYSQGRRMTALQEDNPAIRLAFAGDPARGIPPCAACHGPGAHQLRAPQLKTQQAAYIERQLMAFA